ncbi:response regulator [Sphingobium sp. DEHP117]|uniref:response regulator transcription factor n=1 Tax=Sphingobium sp. DEHP117 TaxID=2993436 RepID=UPI0027D6D1AA|nr:response regulator [Sphingobium sp. DEHP117]MDQ4421001.1 response regulator [Sphingobium sp. DEHP117]
MTVHEQPANFENGAALDANSRKRILVVDDVEGNRAVVCRRLEQHGYEIHQADSGEAALQYIREHSTDLVLLDYMMPNMNGIDVLHVLRRDWNMDTLPVIMLTARAEASAQVEALEAGADDYVTKPIDFEILQARITSLLNRLKASKKIRQAGTASDEREAIRVLTIDNLQNELEREISRRQRAEELLAVDVPRPAQEAAPVSPANGEKVERALEIIDTITRQVVAGQPVNRALLSFLRSIVEKMSAPA